MLSDYFKCYEDPKKIASHSSYYTGDGLIIWANLKFKNFKFSLRGYGRHDDVIQKALKDPKQAVILEVNKSHWVVVVRKNVFGRLIAADPWTGKDCDVIKKYKSITGYALFVRK